MSYVKSTLLPNENLVLFAKIHWIVFFQGLAWLLLALFVFFRMDDGKVVVHVANGIEIYNQFSGQGPVYVEKARFYEIAFAFMFTMMAIVTTIKSLIYYLTTEFAITDKRVIVKIGFIKRDTWELNINRVTSLNVDQSILGRLLDYGDIRVVGMGGSSTPIRAVVNPLQFRRMVLTEVEQAKF